LSVTIPPNTSAKVFLPAIAGAHVTENGSPVEGQPEGGSYIVLLGSGSYTFEVK
jgi:alpha-L-rhamnosidase